MLKQAFATIGANNNGITGSGVNMGLLYQPNAQGNGPSFVQILKNEIRRSLSSEQSNNNGGGSGSGSTSVSVSGKKTKKAPMTPEAEIDKRLNDMFSVFKLLNDNWSLAKKSDLPLQARTTVSESTSNQSSILRIKERNLPGVGGLLVAHPMVRGRMERKVILIVQKTRDSLVGVVLNGEAVDWRMPEQGDSSVTTTTTTTNNNNGNNTASTIDRIKGANGGVMPVMSSDNDDALTPPYGGMSPYSFGSGDYGVGDVGVGDGMGMTPTFVIGDDIDADALASGNFETITIPITIDLIQSQNEVERTSLNFDYDSLREGMAMYEALNDDETLASYQYHRWLGYHWGGPTVDSEPRFIYVLPESECDNTCDATTTTVASSTESAPQPITNSRSSTDVMVDANSHDDCNSARRDKFIMDAQSVGYQIEDRIYIAKTRFLSSIAELTEHCSFEFGRNVPAVYKWTRASLRREIDVGLWFPIEQPDLHHLKELLFPDESRKVEPMNNHRASPTTTAHTETALPTTTATCSLDKRVEQLIVQAEAEAEEEQRLHDEEHSHSLREKQEQEQVETITMEEEINSSNSSNGSNSRTKQQAQDDELWNKVMRWLGGEFASFESFSKKQQDRIGAQATVLEQSSKLQQQTNKSTVE